MKILLLTIALALVRHSTQQINIKVDIDSISGNLTNSTLSELIIPELLQANLTKGYVQSITHEELVVSLCATGTFSSADRDACVQCPSGTASATLGASNDMTCRACSAGTFSGVASSACANCPTNTFSPVYKATDSTQCTACPSNTKSTAGSDNVRSCVCNSGFFVSNNLVSSFDGIVSTLGFEGAGAINLPHVVC